MSRLAAPRTEHVSYILHACYKFVYLIFGCLEIQQTSTNDAYMQLWACELRSDANHVTKENVFWCQLCRFHILLLMCLFCVSSNGCSETQCPQTRAEVRRDKTYIINSISSNMPSAMLIGCQASRSTSLCCVCSPQSLSASESARPQLPHGWVNAFDLVCLCGCDYT